MSNESSLAFKNSGLKVKTSEILRFSQENILTLFEFFLTSLIYKPQILDLKTEDSAMQYFTMYKLFTVQGVPLNNLNLSLKKYVGLFTLLTQLSFSDDTEWCHRVDEKYLAVTRRKLNVYYCEHCRRMSSLFMLYKKTRLKSCA